MKKIATFFIISLCCISTIRADEIQQLKAAITSQLISNNANTALVAGLAERYFPQGVDTDECLMEIVSYALPSDQNVRELVRTMNSDGSWSDIDYHSPSRSAWAGRKHINRMLQITRCYKSPHSDLYGDKDIRDAILRSMNYWFDGGFQCTNWWYNAIGVPKEFAPALLLMEDELSAEMMARGIKILEPAEREATGQNKVWLNGVSFIKGLLLADRSILKRTSEAIRSELCMSPNEGIQYDFSFQQHGAMQQFGNYGLAFASSQSYWMRVFSGTSYDFSKEQKQIMRDYITKGINATVWRGYMDVSSCGRQLFFNSQAGKAISLLLSNLNMMGVDSGEYQEYISRNYTSIEENNMVGNIVFPISKYTIHRGEDFMFSVKMFSKRIIGGEVTNRENLKGYHLADGATMIYRTGREYDNIFAVWDGKYMPGTTVEESDKPLKVLKGMTDYVNGSDFAGGMSCGMYGVSALEYRRDGVSANKSWFFLDDIVVCLGNGITSQDGYPLITTLNQCNYQDGAYYGANSKAVVKGEEYSEERVFCDGVGYESLNGEKIDFKVSEQIGDWHDVADFLPSAEVRGDVFMAQIKHKSATEGDYGYVVRPAIDKTIFMSGKFQDEFVVLQNDTNATAIEIANQNIVMVVFWCKGEVKSTIFGTITATAPVMATLTLDDASAEVKCEIYDPTDSGAKVSMTKR